MTGFLVFWLIVLGGIILLSVVISKVRHPKRKLPLYDYPMLDLTTQYDQEAIERDADVLMWLNREDTGEF